MRQQVLALVGTHNFGGRQPHWERALCVCFWQARAWCILGMLSIGALVHAYVLVCVRYLNPGKYSISFGT